MAGKKTIKYSEDGLDEDEEIIDDSVPMACFDFKQNMENRHM